MKMVKDRKLRVEKAQYRGKMDVVSAPFLVLNKLQEIERFMWFGGYSSNPATVNAALRNRYIYLRTKGTIARGETLHGEELSDHFLVNFQGAKDVHPM